MRLFLILGTALRRGDVGKITVDDVDSIMYFNGWRLSNGWIENRAGGTADAPFLKHPSAAGAWGKPHDYCMPS